MKIILTTKVKDKLKTLALLDSAVSGFIRGDRIGKFLFITDFLQVELDKENIDLQFKKIYKLWGIFLQGFFLKKENFFKSDIFKEKIILLYENKCWVTYFMDINGNKTRPENKKVFCMED